MAGHDIMVIGASVGGIEALSNLVVQLPQDLPAAIFVVQHISPNAPSVLAKILSRSSPLPVKQAQNDDPIRYGQIYVAPPDHHLLVQQEHVQTTRGPRENRSRPAIDPLFRSAATAHGLRVIGVVLTELLDDGTAGLLAVKRCGGIAIVQILMTLCTRICRRVRYPNVEVDYCLPVSKMGAVLR